MEPRENPSIAGHHAARAELARAARGGRLHHAWLLGGPSGIGKATLAFRFARWLLAGMPEGEGLDLPERHPVFRRVAAGSHADLLVIDRTTDPENKRKRFEQVVIAATRLIPPFLAKTPAEGGWRVVILDDADTMEGAAANTTLKVLEDPPPRCLILLLASVPGALLPTIRSRCRRLDLAALPDAELETFLINRLPELPAADRRGVMALAGGSPGRALRLAESNGLKLDGLARRTLEKPEMARVHALADEVMKAEGGFLTFMEMLTTRLSDSLRLAGRGTPDALGAALLRRRPLEAWADVWHGLRRLADETDRANLDPRLAIVSAVAALDGP